MDLIKEELEQIRYQIDLLEAIFDEHHTKKDCCSSCEVARLIKKSFNYYYDYFLHKFGYSDQKEE
jgi:hypothetical protein